MNSQETLNHIELKLTQLITHTEMLKYYLISHYSKFEPSLNEFNTFIIKESNWIKRNSTFHSYTSLSHFAHYQSLIFHLVEHPLHTINYGDIFHHIIEYQNMIYSTLVQFKDRTF
ncbi:MULTISPECIES: hypothetical protein [Staphylococcus]|uniref:hypothetical protein n=1 Tax=Staphylococcus TaxID=1279 RepID=UPI0002463C55|nr:MULTISPECIES: hypothetical protein [Staphylococcus]QAV30268.1 hypothetical protein SD1155_01235 [Sulfitobacter donghicola]AGZ25105.1 hypothetical protein STP1_0795 [Staphylococcus pasteuri SP1]KAB7645263.1 hypothetical protein F9280_07685 [Staphylococcus sp. B2-b]MBN6853031.1 hypothetical protein [Staphylococcus warneri]MBT2769442.1 hypothetical protein [Staphylococcus warneri]